MAPRLRERADRPLHVAEHLPPQELVDRDLTPRQLDVPLEVRLHVAHSPEPPLVGPETPRAPERPRDVLTRIAEVGELPVEQVFEPAVGDDDVADPEVAVADDRVERLGSPLGEPAEAELDRRVRLAD